MARTASESPVTLSVLDRLIDNDPGTSAEVPLSRVQSVRAYRAGVRRDLEWLLNTRRIADEPDAGMVEVNRSVYSYGLPDFSTYSVANPKDQTRLIRFLQQTIKQFEPRLSNVRIVQLEQPDSTKTVHLRIEAMLLMDPAPEQIAFDTVMQLGSGECVIKEGPDAR
jgi:type VI secretion system protein ImpF